MNRIINFGELCRNWRKRNGITIRTIANDLNLDFSTVYKFERNNRASFVILSWYVDHGLDLTFEYTRDMWSENQ